ncbi:MAG: DMT family transporter [Tagaea sp.]|nr:DMT family transporter [Tagaea sp.]
MTKERLALLAAAGTGLQVGVAMVASRAVAGDVDPATLALLRYAIGAAVVVPLVLAARVSWRLSPRDLAAVAALGVVQFGVLIWLLNWGLARVPAADGAVLFATFPLLAQLFAALGGIERLSRDRLLGAIAATAGVALAMGGQFGGGSLAGAVAVLAAAASGAACSVLYRPYLERHAPLAVGAIAMLASTFALAPAALVWGRPITLDASGWAAVAGLGIASGVFYWLWLFALKHAGPARTTVFLALGPPAAALVGAAWLGEWPGIELWAGMIAVAIGLRLATRQR